MRGNAHVRFGGRAGETGGPRGPHRAPVRPYYLDPVGGATLKTALLGLLGPRPKDDERTPSQRRGAAPGRTAPRGLQSRRAPRPRGARPRPPPAPRPPR